MIRGPHTQHHIFDRLSQNSSIKITILDYDIDNLMRSDSIFIKKHEYTGVSRATNKSNVHIIRTAHIKIPYFRRISSVITNFFEILKIIRKERPDVIVGFSLTNGTVGLFLSKLFRIPYIFYCIDLLHTIIQLDFVKGIARIIGSLSFKFADQVIVVTESLRKFAINEGASPKKVKVILNGISMENTIINKEKYELLKKKYSISDEDFVIFFMGFFYDFAGLREIIDYYDSDVKKGKYNLKFILVGDGGIYQSIINHVKQIEAEWVILAGRIPFNEISEYIQLADLCLLSFKLNDITRDITPVKVMEYMAMKKPVLSNNLPNVKLEIGEDNGVIFAENQKDLIKKIAEFIPKKKDLSKIGERGYKLIKEKYDWNELLKEFKSKMIEVIKRKK